MITANLNTLADSLRMWTSPAMKSVYEAAKQQTNADVVGNWIGAIAFIIIGLSLLIFAWLHYKEEHKDNNRFNDDDLNIFIFLIIFGIIMTLISLAFIIPLINIYIAPKYRTIENIMSLVQRMRG